MNQTLLIAQGSTTQDEPVSSSKQEVVSKARLLPERSSFEVSKLLGRGAQASVYVASESNDSPAAANSENTAQLLPQKFALKVFSQWAKPEELQQEATVLEKLSGNPHILQMHGFLESRAKVQIPRSLPEHDNDTFAQWRRGTTTKEKLSVLALELCKHGDFFSYVEKYGAIKDQELLKFLFLQICQGVHALHTEARVAHMDLKLDNILVSDSGHLKLCDLGMAQSVDAEISRRFGTEMYMAPEVANRPYFETYRAVPADIFSLGVLLWILNFGRPPFAKANMSDRNYSLLVRNPEGFWRMHPTVKQYEGEVDADLKALLISMLSLAPSDRPESVANLVNYPFFTKEENLVAPLTNEWVNKAQLFDTFKGQLAAMASSAERED